MNVPVLTIDGPSGAGKGTVSKIIAKQLDWHYLDSGAIYRSLAIAILKAGIDVKNTAEICRLSEQMELEFICGDEFVVLLDNKDITLQLAMESTGKIASIIASYPDVRAALLEKQHSYQQRPGLVADGRDMGSIVFPEAQFKVYLTASSEKRAIRRYKQLIEKGIDVTLIQITQEIEERDQRDSARCVAPLIIPQDALYIDSSDLSLSQVIDTVMNFIRK